LHNAKLTQIFSSKAKKSCLRVLGYGQMNAFAHDNFSRREVQTVNNFQNFTFFTLFFNSSVQILTDRISHK